jgi:uncharacterized protein
MKFSPLDSHGGPVINSCDPGIVVIDGVPYRHSLIILPDRVIRDWSPHSFAGLNPQDFELLARLETDIILLGTGLSQRFPSPALCSAVIEQGIGMEAMSTAAACRTFNILMSEGRRVAAALLLS